MRTGNVLPRKNKFSAYLHLDCKWKSQVERSTDPRHLVSFTCDSMSYIFKNPVSLVKNIHLVSPTFCHQIVRCLKRSRSFHLLMYEVKNYWKRAGSGLKKNKTRHFQNGHNRRPASLSGLITVKRRKMLPISIF